MHGGINYVKYRLRGGRSTFELKMDHGKDVNDFTFTVKTMAARHVKIKRQGSRSDYQCYTFEDAIGNFDIKTNGVSNNCSKRTPPNWWHSANHQPGGGYNSGSRGTPSTNSCVENALKNPHRTRGITRKSTGHWNEYFYGKINCPGGSWVIAGVGGPDSRNSAKGSGIIFADT